MEKNLQEALQEGARSIGLALGDAEQERLLQLLEMLLTWNRKVSLTSVVEPLEAVEAHLVDSLAPLGLLEGVGTALDLGAGPGLPGLPLALVRPETRWTLVESVGKKVGFMKAAIGALRLSNARALQLRAGGEPEREGLERAQLVVSRAFLPPEEWLGFGARYLAPGGRLVVMLGEKAPLPSAAGTQGLRLIECRHYRLPRSGAERRLAVYG